MEDAHNHTTTLKGGSPARMNGRSDPRGTATKAAGSRVWLFSSSCSAPLFLPVSSHHTGAPRAPQGSLEVLWGTVYDTGSSWRCALALWGWEEALAAIPGAMQLPGSPTCTAPALNILPHQALTMTFATDSGRFFSSSSDRYRNQGLEKKGAGSRSQNWREPELEPRSPTL